MKVAKQRKIRFTYCGCCDSKKRVVYTARQNTTYHDASRNLFTGCKQCHNYNTAYWDEMWREYWGGRL